jgi:hypothetical protein
VNQEITNCVSAGLLAITVLTVTSPSLFAQGTAAEREACTPDVFRLCGSFIPNAVDITACLKERKTSLSEGCRKVIYPDNTSRSSDLHPQTRNGR